MEGLAGLIIGMVICWHLSDINKGLIDLKKELSTKQCERDING